MESSHITYAQCPYAAQSCQEIDRLDAARELYAAVLEAVDEGIPVRWEWSQLREQMEVDVECDGTRWVVWSVEEAVQLTEGE